MNKVKILLIMLISTGLTITCTESFRHIYSSADNSLSASMQRYVSQWNTENPRDNEFYTSFRYFKVRGLGYEEGISRRDPSSIIHVDGKYYVFYTRSSSKIRPVGYDKATITDPATTWDLCDIFYATSRDGKTWTERGPAVVRGEKGKFDDRSVFTPDVMIFNDKYYLYYQAVKFPFRRRTKNVIAMSWSNSVEGPWYKLDEPVLLPGPGGEWEGEEDNRSRISTFGAFDSHKVHDPNVIIRNGKIWMYYKAHPMGVGSKMKKPYPDFSMGLAIASKPDGPFEKHPLNPISASGHEALVWPYREGVASLITANGPEKNTVQWARDGVNFYVKSHVVLPPDAAGLYVRDKYTNTRNGEGFTWGLSHIAQNNERPWAYIIGFECDLSSKIEDNVYKRENIRFDEQTRIRSTL